MGITLIELVKSINIWLRYERVWSSIFGPSRTTRLQTPEVYL